MKLNKVILSGVVALSCVSASAQEADKTVNVFTPHWYAQAQIGGQYTLGEIGFGKLLSPNAQVGVGYNFNQVRRSSFFECMAEQGWSERGWQRLQVEVELCSSNG